MIRRRPGRAESRTGPRALAAVLVALVVAAPAVGGATDATGSGAHPSEGPTDAPGEARPDTTGERPTDPAATGRVAAPIEVPLDGPSLAVAGQFFAGYASSLRETDDVDGWDLDRAELGFTWTQPFHHRIQARDFVLGGELRLETVREATAPGDTGSPWTLRPRHAWAFSESRAGRLRSGAGVGIVPDVWLQTVEARYDLRSLAPTLAERADLYPTSDLGGRVWFDLDDRVRLDVSATNGEGGARPDTNDAANLTAVLTAVPLALDVHRGPLSIAVHGAWRSGRVGPESARDHRASAALTFVGPCPRAGFAYHRAFGYLDDGAVVADGYSAWANSYLGTPWVGAAVRYDRMRGDVDRSATTTQRTTVALYSGDFGVDDRTDRVTLRAMVGVEIDRYDADARPLDGPLSAVDTERFFVRFAFDGRRQVTF